MMEKHWLQLFAEGEGGQTGGETAPDAGEQTLEQLGVPAELIRKRAKRTPQKAAAPAAPTQEAQRVAAAEQPEKEKPAAQKRMTWDEIMADPEYNRQMQETVRQRLQALGAKQSLTDLGVPEEKLPELLRISPLIRNRLTLMRARRMLDL